jgi:hypothetical protein
MEEYIHLIVPNFYKKSHPLRPVACILYDELTETLRGIPKEHYQNAPTEKAHARMKARKLNSVSDINLKCTDTEENEAFTIYDSIADDEDDTFPDGRNSEHPAPRLLLPTNDSSGDENEIYASRSIWGRKFIFDGEPKELFNKVVKRYVTLTYPASEDVIRLWGVSQFLEKVFLSTNLSVTKKDELMKKQGLLPMDYFPNGRRMTKIWKQVY